ncbi:RNI-like protein [Guyanagaster necrorhizus]|uniref:RNI-like protein n=1 Tax=Guyanagaster necrorhizus TaxID=856835 RepID=A0A9P7VHY1_9AGAR|nr:RNI-like protein [Guyanagaster necrorhizus MCA 3950]KAG7440903.1 RNI-like protein [Guyanagaster necrorhizus MCA 3950]
MANTLSLHGQGLKLDSRADIEPLLAGIDPTKIEEIHLGGNTIGVDASVALAEFLSKATNLKIADLADIFTGRLITEIPLALTAICNALVDKTSLIELDLSDNAFGGRSVDPMVPFLTNNRSFQVLKLNNNGLGPVGGKVLADALFESARISKSKGEKSNLRTVICGRNRLEDGSAPSWAEAFAAHGTLTEVRMPQNGIRMAGITALARGLAKNPGLQFIDLQDNTFTDDGQLKGVEAWTESLASWPELTALNLSDCVLSGEGELPQLVTAIAEGSNPKLHTLQLQNNNLEAETFALFAEHISGNLKGLKLLELQWNDAEDDDVSLETVRLSMKQRGGKLIVDDEEEEEEEEEAEEEEEKEEVKEEQEAVLASTIEEPTPKKPDTTDELADLMSKVEIQ